VQSRLDETGAVEVRPEQGPTRDELQSAANLGTRHEPRRRQRTGTALPGARRLAETCAQLDRLAEDHVLVPRVGQ
jgi:hypothetical protein